MARMTQPPRRFRQSSLLAASISLLVALLMLSGASFAWFTLSSHPAISSLQVSVSTNKTLLVGTSATGEFGQLLNLGSQLSRYVELKPVSTTDGINWFLPTYEMLGPLKHPSQFILDDNLNHANALKIDRSGNPLEGLALKDARAKGYYVYAEFWLKTEEPACNVRLSVPGTQSLDNWEIKQGTYGSYALSSYTRSNEEGVVLLDQQAQTALRVGFLVDPDNPGQRSFVIYEPNADQRSSMDKPFSENELTASQYVLDYNLHEDLANYQEGYYIPTFPVGLSADGLGEVTTPDYSRLIIQKKSSWDLDALEAVLAGQQRLPGSNEVAVMGRFIANNALVAGQVVPQTGMAKLNGGVNETIAGQPVILRLEQETPRKVRLFFWIEGQDVDCWNDIAAGSIVISLELAGETL